MNIKHVYLSKLNIKWEFSEDDFNDLFLNQKIFLFYDLCSSSSGESQLI